MFLKIYQLLNKLIPEWLSIEEPETLSILLKQHNIDVKKDTFNIINGRVDPAGPLEQSPPRATGHRDDRAL